MFTKFSTAAILALASTSMVAAQTSTECNPLQEDCPADPAFGKDGLDCDFTKGECDGFTSLGTKITYDSKGATFPMSKDGDAPTLRSDKYLFFGYVEVKVRAAEGKGIVTSMVLQSDDLDEIDFETVGSDNNQIQSNYFSKGNDSTYDRGGFHAVDSPLTKTHTYAFNWTAQQIDWIIDGVVVRTLKASDVGSEYPGTPMQLKIGAWVAGYEGNSPGTIEWSGGIADFSNGTITAVYQSVKVIDYAGGSSATDKKVKEYVYGDRSGSPDSIQVIPDDGSSSSSSSSASGSSSATSSAASSSASSSAASSTTVASATSSASNSTGNSSTRSGSTATGSSVPTSIPNGTPKTGLALGAVALGFVAALAL
ncbi:hypothetical protein MY11210_009363 [Beauveria gryllotalpidicola]